MIFKEHFQQGKLMLSTFTFLLELINIWRNFLTLILILLYRYC